MLVQVLLILLGPSRQSITMISVERAAAKLTHDERFLILRFPFQSIGLFRQTVVPSHILITAEHAQVLSERVIYHFRLIIYIVTLHVFHYQSPKLEASYVP